MIVRLQIHVPSPEGWVDREHASYGSVAVTRRIVEALERRRPRARYAIPDQRFTYWLAPRMLPDRWLDRIIDRVLGYRKIRDRLE